MSQQRKDTSAEKHEQIQQGVQQRSVLHKNPTRGATIPLTYLRRMYQLYTNWQRTGRRTYSFYHREKQESNTSMKPQNYWTNGCRNQPYSVRSYNDNAKSPPAETLKKLKAKDHLKALERHLESWISGDLLVLLKEARTIQKSLRSKKRLQT